MNEHTITAVEPSNVKARSRRHDRNRRRLKNQKRRHSGRRHYLMEQAMLADASWMEEVEISRWH